jgi:GDPmannose 4,6-dehydratase
MSRALVTGVKGQDGIFLAEFLLSKGYTVYGLDRSLDDCRIKHLLSNDCFKMIPGDLTNQASLENALRESEAEEVYNLGAMSFVEESFRQPEITFQHTGQGVLNMLQAIWKVNRSVRFFQASSSEMFGNNLSNPQDETSPFCPCSPYGRAKLFGHRKTIFYRKKGLYACSGILFNHESHRRAPHFVTRKITLGVARIYMGLQDELELGNLDARRDWGYAPEYVEAMWKMLQQNNPTDFVIATGESHSVQDILDIAFGHIGIYNWQPYVKGYCEHLKRLIDIDELKGNPSAAREQLEWNSKTNFEQLIREMVQDDLFEIFLQKETISYEKEAKDPLGTSA